MSDTLTRIKPALSDRYVIDREIGAGGMATVYLAEDIKHRRKVALKVLRPELGAVLGADRFLAEINVTANLQHPHLLPLFDSGEADGLLFYVMPFVRGESLRHRLAREHQLPIEEAVRIAIAVAGALDYAHRHGVIHRDLKPENILLQDGQPMIADFGIALAISNASGERVTQTGLSLGTPQYMSPEQATGERGIDARTDIYSLAAVLYEMLVGDPPHIGHSAQAIIAKVLTDRPARPRVLRETVPEHVDAAIMRGLAKLPADRFNTAAEFAETLSGARAASTPTAGPVSRTSSEDPNSKNVVLHRLRTALTWAPLAVTTAVLLALVTRERTESQHEPQPALFEVAFSDSIVIALEAALSRDGTQLAFLGNGPEGQAIYHRRLDVGLEVHAIRGTENGNAPEFSPDGASLLFEKQGKLWKVPVSGGTPITIADSATGASWREGDQVLFERGNEIWRVSANGGAQTRVAQLDSGQGHLRYGLPFALPGGKKALITIWKGGTELGSAHLGIVRLRDGKVTELNTPGFNPRYLPSGHIVFGQIGGSVFAATFSIRKGRFTGPPVPMLEQVRLVNRGMRVALSDNGLVVYQTEPSATQVVQVQRNAQERVLLTDSSSLSHPRLDPTGTRIAVTRVRGGKPDIWIYELISGARIRLTRDSNSFRPEWSPDGKRIFYVSQDRGQIRMQPWDGSGRIETLPDTGFREVFISRKANVIALTTRDAGGDIWIGSADSLGKLRPLLNSPFAENVAAVSPDGELVAYASDETGRNFGEVYVRRISGAGASVPVSLAGGDEPMWAPSGEELFYRTPGRVLMAATVTQQPDLAVTARDSLFPDPYQRNPAHAGYDMFPGGKSFVFVRPFLTARGFYGITNWTVELKRRTSGKAQPR